MKTPPFSTHLCKFFNLTMTPFSSPNTTNKVEINLTIVSSYILSNPLYFSYLIFFSPCLFKLLSFLSPLLCTTFLLFLSLLTSFVPLRSVVNSKDGFFLTAYNAIIDNFRPSFDDDDDEPIEEFEVYRVVFHHVPEIEIVEAYPVEFGKFGENPIAQLEEKTDFQCGNSTSEQETGDTNHGKQEGLSKSSESEVTVLTKTASCGSLKVKNDEKFTEAFQQTDGVQKQLGSFGSMRKEKEWRRTLACKLFEERHNWSNNDINLNGNNDVEEGMDLLWEIPETEIKQGKLLKVEENNNKKEKRGKGDDKIEWLLRQHSPSASKGTRQWRGKGGSESVNNENGEESEEFDDYYDGGKICCLQALKLSAGKMNLSSVATPNLAKLSKAFKGIGWLHSHVRRQKKKGCK